MKRTLSPTVSETRHAVEYELQNTTLKCLNQSCPWEGESRFYQVIKMLYVQRDSSTVCTVGNPHLVMSGACIVLESSEYILYSVNSWFLRIKHVPRTFRTANLISHACKKVVSRAILHNLILRMVTIARFLCRSGI